MGSSHTPVISFTQIISIDFPNPASSQIWYGLPSFDWQKEWKGNSDHEWIATTITQFIFKPITLFFRLFDIIVWNYLNKLTRDTQSCFFASLLAFIATILAETCWHKPKCSRFFDKKQLTLPCVGFLSSQLPLSEIHSWKLIIIFLALNKLYSIIRLERGDLRPSAVGWWSKVL